MKEVLKELDLLTLKNYLIIIAVSVAVSIPLSLLRNYIYKSYKEYRKKV